LIGGVIFYDVLHYLKKVERKKLYSETHRVLKKDGFFSIYPKHVIEDSPLDQFKQLTLDDVKKEIQDFNFQEKNCDMISYDDFLNPGCVFNFVKMEMIIIKCVKCKRKIFKYKKIVKVGCCNVIKIELSIITRFRKMCSACAGRSFWEFFPEIGSFICYGLA